MVSSWQAEPATFAADDRGGGGAAREVGTEVPWYSHLEWRRRWPWAVVAAVLLTALLGGVWATCANSRQAQEPGLRSEAVRFTRAIGTNDLGTVWDMRPNDWQKRHSPKSAWVHEHEVAGATIPVNPTSTTYTASRVTWRSDNDVVVAVRYTVPGQAARDTTVGLHREGNRWAEVAYGGEPLE